MAVVLRLGGGMSWALVVFGPWERQDGVRKGMAESREGAVRSVPVRHGRERRPELLQAAAD